MLTQHLRTMSNILSAGKELRWRWMAMPNRESLGTDRR